MPAVPGRVELLGPIRSCYCRPGKSGVSLGCSCVRVVETKISFSSKCTVDIRRNDGSATNTMNLPENCKRWRASPSSSGHTLRVWDSTAFILDFAFRTVYRQQRGQLYLRVQRLPVLPAHPPFSRVFGASPCAEISPAATFRYDHVRITPF